MMKAVFVFTLLFVLSACWPYSVSLIDKGSKPEEWKYFSVLMLENNAPNTPLSYAANLTEKLKDDVQNNAGMLLHSESGKGEVVIQGTITNYNVNPVALQADDNAAKNRLTVSVQFSIFISAPKEEKMELVSTRFVDYDSNTDLASVENQLLDEINLQITQDVINKLLSNW